jgi:hypothetical protein
MIQGNFMAKSTKTKDMADLTLLGSGKTAKPVRELETFPNHHQRNYTVTLSTEEFTCVCPMTGQPDFVPQRRSLSRTCHQYHPRRPGGCPSATLVQGHGRIRCTRRYCH